MTPWLPSRGSTAMTNRIVQFVNHGASPSSPGMIADVVVAGLAVPGVADLVKAQLMTAGLATESLVKSFPQWTDVGPLEGNHDEVECGLLELRTGYDSLVRLFKAARSVSTQDAAARFQQIRNILTAMAVTDFTKAMPAYQEEAEPDSLNERVPRIQDNLEAKLQDIREAYSAAVKLHNVAKAALGPEAGIELGKIRSVFNRQSAAAIRIAYRELWKLGREAAGITKPMGPDEALQLQKLHRDEAQFFQNLLLDIEQGTGKMPMPQRVSMYGQGAREAYWAGYVMGDQSAGRYLQWFTSAGREKHCKVCPILAHGGQWGKGIYSAQELSRAGYFPQSGKLPCCTHCGCGLRQVPRPTTKPLAKGDPRRVDLDDIAAMVKKMPKSSSFHGNGRSGREGLHKRAVVYGKWTNKGRNVRPGPIAAKGRKKASPGKSAQRA